MADIKQYFIDQEERVSNTYMSASGEPQLQKPTFRSKYKLEIHLLKALAVLGVIGYYLFKEIKK